MILFEFKVTQNLKYKGTYVACVCTFMKIIVYFKINENITQ